MLVAPLRKISSPLLNSLDPNGFSRTLKRLVTSRTDRRNESSKFVDKRNSLRRGWVLWICLMNSSPFEGSSTFKIRSSTFSEEAWVWASLTSFTKIRSNSSSRMSFKDSLKASFGSCTRKAPLTKRVVKESVFEVVFLREGL